MCTLCMLVPVVTHLHLLSCLGCTWGKVALHAVIEHAIEEKCFELISCMLRVCQSLQYDCGQTPHCRQPATIGKEGQLAL